MFSDHIRRLRRLLDLATPQIRRPAVIGAVVLFILLSLALLGLSRTENPFTLPSTLDDEQAISYHVWGLKQRSLLMVLPIGAFLVVLARSFVGLKAFGLFTPMLIALAFLQMGPIIGPLVLMSSIFVGMVVAPQLLKLRMTRVGFLGVLISFVVFVLAAAQEFLDKDISVDAFPVVVTALCVERWWRQWEKDGAIQSARMALNTLVIALVIQFIMVSHVALALINISPLILPSLAALAIALLGRYRGLRMTELARFAPLWLEEKRNALTEQKPYEIPTDRPMRPSEIAEALNARRDPWDQPTQCDHSEIQPAPGDRTGEGQGRGEDGIDGSRGDDDGDDLRRRGIS